MPITGEGQIRNTRARILRSATCWLFAMITVLRNSQELQDSRIFEKNLTGTQRARNLQTARKASANGGMDQSKFFVLGSVGWTRADVPLEAMRSFKGSVHVRTSHSTNV